MGGIAARPGDAGLLERSGELDALSRALASVTFSGQGRIALVAGEAGIGKTALLRQFAASAASSARVLWARCEPLFTPRPLGPVLELASAIGGEAAARAAGPGTPYDVAMTLFPDLAIEPTVVVFEDVHWADEATLDVVRLLARRVAGAPVLLVLSYREAELDHAHPLRVVLGDLPGGGQVIRLELAGLSARAIAELAGPGRMDAGELHRRTAGNPFYVTEVLAAGAETMPRSVRDAVLARAARLRGVARDLLDVASVVPGPVETWLLDALAPTAAELLDECLVTGMLVLAADRVEFRHEIARQVVEESMPPGRRKAMHRAALAALTSAAAGQQDPARLMHHADAAGDAQAVLEYAPAAAAQAAAAGGRREAARLYERALRFAGMLEPDRHAALLEGFADAAYYTELSSEATQALRKAVAIHAERGDHVRHGDALRRLGNQLGKDGALAESTAAISEAMALLEQQPPGRELACAYNSMAAVTGIFDDDGAVLWGKKAIEVAEQAGCLDAVGETLNIVGTAELRQGNLGGLEKLDRSREIAELTGDEIGMARAYMHPTAALAGRREWVLAEPYIRQGREFCRERGLHGFYGWLTAFAAEAALAQGRWAEAVGTAAEILAWPADGFGQFRVTALVVTATVGARRGESGYQGLLDEAAMLAQAEPPTARAGAQLAALRAEAAWLAGAEPWPTGEAAWPAAAGPAVTRWFAGDTEVWRHRAGLDSGDPADLPEPYRMEITGDADGAARWWQERGCAYDAALALACSGGPLLMRRALDMLHDLGAQPAAAVVARRLHALGERGLPRGPRPATAANPAGLTSREAEVLTLVAAGLANPEIAARLVLSGRTVDNHVAAILRKLGVAKRAEARAAAMRLGLVSDIR
jgi:DNA-binding CsgD family transcriptional regulator